VKPGIVPNGLYPPGRRRTFVSSYAARTLTSPWQAVVG